MTAKRNALDVGFAVARPALLAVVFFSLCINLLMLVSPLYMLQIYDRVLISRSVDTLLLLSLVAVAALIVLGVLEAIRARVLVRVGARFDQGVSDSTFAVAMYDGLGAQPLRDLATVRSFMTGRSLLALFDAPWTPIYLLFVYLLHPWLGHVALTGAVLLLVIALVNERATRTPLKESAGRTMVADRFVDAGCRNRDAIWAMGMLPGLRAVWRKWHHAGLSLQARASDISGVAAGSARALRFTIQVAILGVGAYLAINEITSAGVMIAASIISSRALAPIEVAIAGWHQLLSAREARTRLRDWIASDGDAEEPMRLPQPKGDLVFDNVFAAPPGADRHVVTGMSFRIEPGTSVGLTGPSAAGKSSVARLMVGIWQPLSGLVRLDGAEFAQWSRDVLGPYIGYLPQDVELFPGTVAENIARFGKVDAQAVVDAAKLAGAHETIVGLSDGYATEIGAGGENLSGGQRQRIGLARAFYRRPALIVLDEPTSNLDAQGEATVRNAVDELKQGGSTVIVIAHRPTLVGGVDKMMVVQKGALTHYGPTAEVMPQITRRLTVGNAVQGA